MKVTKDKRNSEMDASIGVNLRVTAHSNQGGRKYMEDMFCVAYQPTSDEKDLLYAYFGIFDGHGGREAALYAKTHLMDHIVSQKNFWSDEDEMVLKAIKDGFISVHHAMWRELDKWPKTQSGLPSTSGTTASVAFVRRGKLYIGHVGDSGIVLGYQDPESNYWMSRPLTRDHKPESPAENARIRDCGGKVVTKSGVPRVVWNRPRLGHRGPVRRSTPIDEIPFLAVARSLGDLWSYNSEQDEFVVSPVPDVAVIEIDVSSHRCLILGSDGLWNMLTAQDAVNSVFFAEKSNEHQNILAANSDHPNLTKNWMNPSKRLVDRALDRWYGNNLRADNTSVVTVVIDPPGPPKKPSSSSSSEQPGKAGARFKAVYTRHPVARQVNRSPTVSLAPPPNCIADSPIMPPTARLPPRTSLPNTSGSPRPFPNATVANIKKKKPLGSNSSKTSRVLIRDGPIPGSSLNLSPTPLNRVSPANTPSLKLLSNTSAAILSSVVAEISNELDPGVQIHEISSSSVESVKSEGADLSNLVKQELPAGATVATAASETKKVVRLRQTAGAARKAVNPQQTTLKRTNRQSNETSEDEAVSRRKIMKVATDPAPATTSEKPTATGATASTESSSSTVNRLLRNRKNVGKPTAPLKSRVLTKRPMTTLNVREKGRKGVKPVGSTPTTIIVSVPTPPRATRGSLQKDVVPSTVPEPMTESRSSDQLQQSLHQHCIRLQPEPESSKGEVEVKSQRTRRNKQGESQTVPKGKRGQAGAFSERNTNTTGPEPVPVTLLKKKPLTNKQIVVPEESTSTKVAAKVVVHNKTLRKRLQQGHIKPKGTDNVASNRSSLRREAEDAPTERSLRSGTPAGRNRVTRSMKQ